LGHGFCSYSDKDEVKETTCPDKCENKILSYMSPAGSTANKCDKDSGWACDYTVTAVGCCGDKDCPSVGGLKGVCSKDVNKNGIYDPGDYTCSNPKCTEPNSPGCDAGYCCVDSTREPDPAKRGTCFQATNPYSSTWLCAQ